MSVRTARLAMPGLVAFLGLCGTAPLPAQPAPPDSGASNPGGQGKTRVTPPPQPSPAVQKAMAQFQRAITLHKNKKTVEAIAAYKEYLALAIAAKMPNRNLLPAYRNLVLLYQVRNDLKAAEAAMLKVIEIEPRDIPTHIQLALLYSAQRRFPEAQKFAAKVLSLNPPQEVAAPAHFVLGNVAVARKDFPDAEKEFGQASRLSPKNPQAHFNYGYALAQQKKFKPALVAFEKARELGKTTQSLFYIAIVKQQMTPPDIPGAIATYTLVLKEDPNHADARINRAMLLQSIGGKTQEAISDYLAVLERKPERFLAHFNVGQLYENLGNRTAAHQHFLAAYRIKPNDVRSLSALALMETEAAASDPEPIRRDDKFKQAAERYKQAMALDPKNVAAQNGLGYLYERWNRPNEALAVYRKLQAADPNSPLPYYRIARVYTGQRNVDKVVETWKEYRQHKPDDPTSYEEAARILEAQAKFEPAMAEWKLLQTRKMDPGSKAGAMVSIGKDLVQLKRLEEARAQYKAVLDLDMSAKGVEPRLQALVTASLEAARFDAWRGLARVAQAENKPEEAVSWWNQLKTAEAVRASKANRAPSTEAYVEIAQIHEAAKKPDLAIQEYRAMTQAAPRDQTPYMQIGRLYAAQNKTSEAVEAYREAAKRAKDPIQFRLQIADLYRRTGKMELALTEYESLMAENPKEMRAYSAAGLAYEQAGKDDRALAVYEKLYQADSSQSWVLGREAIVLTRLKRYDAARALYEKMLDRNPEDYQSYTDLANVYRAEGKSEAYLKWLQARFEKAPNQRAPLNALADEFARQKQEAAGWAYLRSIAEKRKTDRPFQERYATLLIQHNRIADAIAVYRQIAAQYPNDLNAQTTLADQLDFSGNRAEATKMVETLLTRKDLMPPQRLLLQRRLAERYVQAGKSVEAIPLLQTVVQADPSDFVSAGMLAQLLTAAGRELEALPLYLRLREQPAYPRVARAQIMVKLGGIYEKQGKKSDAVAQYREALKLNAKDAEAIAALNRLGEKL